MEHKNGFPLVPLGKLLTKSKAWIEFDPTARYREVMVRLWGNGVVLRHEVAGSEIAAGRRLQVQTDQFIISRIDARHGASGLIPPERNGAVVSSDFPVFTPDEGLILSQFPGWLSKTYQFIDLCLVASEGTTNRPDLPMIALDDLRAEMEIDPADDQGAVVQAAKARARELLRRQQPFAWNATNITRSLRRQLVDLFTDYGAGRHRLCRSALCRTAGT
jgi:type I restriction enzyme S subunit